MGIPATFALAVKAAFAVHVTGTPLTTTGKFARICSCVATSTPFAGCFCLFLLLDGRLKSVDGGNESIAT